jgi:hypothetical protein
LNLLLKEDISAFLDFHSHIISGFNGGHGISDLLAVPD